MRTYNVQMDTGARSIPVYSSPRISAVCARTRIKMSETCTPTRTGGEPAFSPGPTAPFTTTFLGEVLTTLIWIFPLSSGRHYTDLNPSLAELYPRKFSRAKILRTNQNPKGCPQSTWEMPKAFLLLIRGQSRPRMLQSAQLLQAS